MLSLRCCGSLSPALGFWAANLTLVWASVPSFMGELVDQMTSEVSPGFGTLSSE